MDQTHPLESDLDFYPFDRPAPPPAPRYPNHAGMGVYTIAANGRVAGWRPLTQVELGALWGEHAARHQVRAGKEAS